MKKLTLILALLLVAGLTAAAYAEVQNVKVSGDITVLGIARELDLRGSRDIAGDINLGTATPVHTDYRSLATIARVRVDADLTDNVMTTVRLLNERYWGLETDANGDQNNDSSDIALDLAYVTLKEFLYSPLTLTVGRQELHFGNDMIMGDPDTNAVVDAASPFSQANAGVAPAIERDADLSARKAFDAIRATLNYNPLTIDIIAAKIMEANLNQNDDGDLYGINANYNLGGKYSTLLEGYWFTRRIGRWTYRNNAGGFNNAPSKKVDVCNTVGGRVVAKPHERIVSQLEAAYQFGQYVPLTNVAGAPLLDPATIERKAWALEFATTLDLSGKVKYSPSLTLGYAYFSGDHENNAHDNDQGAWRGWDPMFENQNFGRIANALSIQTNAHILNGMVTAQVTEDVKFTADYYAFWYAKAFPDASGQFLGPGLGGTLRNTAAVTQPLMTTGRRFAGHEIDLTTTYDYTEDVQFSLMTDWLIPGAAFDDSNDSVAREIIGSMKVTF